MTRTVEAIIRKAPENPGEENWVYTWAPVTTPEEAIIALASTMMDDQSGLAENLPVEENASEGRWNIYFNEHWDSDENGVIHVSGGWPTRYEVHAPTVL